MPYTQAQVDDLTRYVRAGSNDDDLDEDIKARWSSIVESALHRLLPAYDEGNSWELLLDAGLEQQDEVIAQVVYDATPSDFTHVFRAERLTAAYYVVARDGRLYTAWLWGGHGASMDRPPKKLQQDGWRFQLEGEQFTVQSLKEEEGQ